MLTTLSSSDIHHQWPPHEVIRIWARTEANRRCHWGTQPMDRAVWGMQGLDVVKVVRHSSHLNHALPVVRCEALDLRPPGIVG